MRIHLIAIGGSAMHSLALALHGKGYSVTGSDDEISEPSRSRLQNAGLLPEQEGWFPAKIHPGLDAVILGMHARADNPELIRAKELGLKIFSYPEYLYVHSRSKKRVVIGGSHGKTTITSAILHVLKYHGKDFDFMAGARIPGFENMVRLSGDAPMIVLEGDEYLSSPIDRRPKFHLYRPHIALLSGIAWDHINVFPNFEEYLEQFRIFIGLIEKGGTLVWCEVDPHLQKLAGECGLGLKMIPYRTPAHIVREGISILQDANGKEYPLKVFGRHNLLNLEGARLVLQELGVTAEQFYEAIVSFSGAAKRLELVRSSGSSVFYKDFAHSPSKLKATLQSMKDQFPGRGLVAVMELHTFSSLNEQFLGEYYGSMDAADRAVVYFNPHTIAHKKLKPVTEELVRRAFGRSDLQVLTESSSLLAMLRSQDWKDRNLLMMSSGNFDGLDLDVLGKELFGNGN